MRLNDHIPSNIFPTHKLKKSGFVEYKKEECFK